MNGQLELFFLENKVEFNFINQNDVILSGSSDLIRIAEIGPVKIDTQKGEMRDEKDLLCLSR